MNEQHENADSRESLHSETARRLSNFLEKFSSSSPSESNSVGELVDKQGERQNAKEREHENDGQRDSDVEIVQQIEKGNRFLLLNKVSQHHFLHLNGHALRQPLLR